MGRHRKYSTATIPVSLSMEKELIDLIDHKAKKVGKNRSEFIVTILTHFAYTDGQFCNMMARKAAQDLYYWKSKEDMLKAEPELFKEIPIINP